MDRQLNEFNILYSVISLSNAANDIRDLKRKLDPTNFDAADTHLSVEEKYEIRRTLEGLLVDIAMLEREVDQPTGDQKPQGLIRRILNRK